MMFLGLFKNEHFIPSMYVDTIFDIDYNKLYEDGIRLILTDLDNTLISYKETEPLEAQYAWVKKMNEIGFEIIIVSNNSHKERVSRFAELLDIKYLNFALKPTKIGMKKALKMARQKYNSNEVVALGDQLMTDILVANRMKFHSILVKAVDRKSDILPTRINRKLERHVLKVLRKKNSESYKEKLSAYVEDSYGKN